MDCFVPPGAITSLYGVRVLSMWWVILGHTYLWLLMYRFVSKFDSASVVPVVQFCMHVRWNPVLYGH